MDNKEFQKTVLESFTRLEEGQAEFRQEIKFVRDDLNSKIEMIANAVKQLVEKIDTNRIGITSNSRYPSTALR